MLPIKLERAIFIIIFIVCVFTCMYFSTQIKENELPINEGMTPEQVIESEYGDLPYKYIIKDNIMFVIVDMKTGYCQLNFAFRNDKSGFMFEVPGFLFKPTSDKRIKRIYFEEANPLILTVLKKDNKYYIDIDDPFEKKDIEVFYDGIKLDIITFDSVNNQHWVCAVEDLSEFDKIECIYNGEKIKIIDADELKAMYGEVQ